MTGTVRAAKATTHVYMWKVIAARFFKLKIMKQTVVQIKIVYIVAHERIIERYEFDDIEEWDIFFDSLKYFASCVERKFKAYMTYNIPIINYKID